MFPTLEAAQVRFPHAEAIQMDHTSVPELTPVTTCARLVLANGANAVQASFSAAKYAIYDMSGDPETAIASGSLTVSTVVFDTLQTDGYWTADALGYNFRHTYAGTLFTRGGGSYLIEYALTLAAGGQITLRVPIGVTHREQAA